MRKGIELYSSYINKNCQSTKIICQIRFMSFIKTDSLFSNLKYGSYHLDRRPSDSTSNIFKSIFDNLEPKQKSIKIQSIFQVNGNYHSTRQCFSLMDKLITPGIKESNPQSFHYNWIVCKNSGLSEEEDNVQCSNQKSKKSTQHSQIKSQINSYQDKEIIVNNLAAQKNELGKKMKNQTKNIPKNYGKAIISFIEKNRSFIEATTSHLNVDYDEFLADLKKRKKSINTIADLRDLWSNFQHAKCMRIITCIFLRKHALKYIFDSRICTFTSHIKYRQRLSEAVANPKDFMHIKDY